MVGSLFFLTSVVTANEVVSTNIVGYLVNTNVPPSYLTGPTFVPVLSCLQDNPDFTILLEDITIEGMHLSFDSIQFLSPDDSSTIVEAVYSSIPAIKGWWKLGSPGVESLDDIDFPAGAAILCNFQSGNSVKFTFPDPMLPLVP